MATKIKRKSLSHSFEAETKEEVILAAPALEPEEAGPLALPWLTWETALWVLVAAAAVALRLWDLGLYPLSNAEAGQSLIGLQVYRGEQPQADLYSPLLVTLNSLAFVLFGASDASARLASVLLGSLLVLLPWTLRPQLGRVTCLIAAALLAISPTAVYLSRTLNGEIGTAAAALLMAAGFFNWADSGRKSWLLVLAGGLALLLTSGPMAVSVLLVFALVVLIRLPVFRALWAEALARTEQPLPSPSTDGAGGEAAAQPNDQDPNEAEEDAGPPAQPALRQAAIFFGVSLVLLASAGLFNLAGISVLGNLLLNWLGRLGLDVPPEAGFNAVFLLTVYEPLLVFAGLVGLALVILRSDRPLEFTLGAWFVGLLLLDLLMGGRPAAGAILPLVPLALLAGLALGELADSLLRWGSWGNEGLLLATGLVIAVFTYISLTGWLDRICEPEDRLCELAWLQPVAAALLFVVVLVFFWLISEPGVAYRGAALVGAAVGLLIALNTGARLNYGPLMNQAYQPLAGIPASPQLVLLTETLAQESVFRVSDPTLLETSLVDPVSPALAWQLRDYRNLTRVSSPAEAPPEAAAIITPATVEELGRGEAFVGQDFALDAFWSPVGLPAKELFKWLVYREINQLPLSNQAVLWLRVER